MGNVTEQRTPHIITSVKRIFGKDTNLRFSTAHKRLAERQAVLASNAETAIAFIEGKTRGHYDLVTRTAALYHVKGGHRYIAFDDDPKDNVLIELADLLEHRFDWFIPPALSEMVRRQMERAYDTKRVVCIDGKDAQQTRTKNGYKSISYHNNQFTRGTRPRTPDGSTLSRDQRYHAFFGSKEVTERFSQFAFERNSTTVPLYVEGDLKYKVKRMQEDGDVLVRGCHIHSTEEGVTYLGANTHYFTHSEAGLGVRKKSV